MTTYVGSGVYQSSHPLNISNATGIDTLQYLAQEEGRIRPKNFGLADTMYYDYFAKDHLGNTRVVLTDELQRDAYPDASLEDATIANESLYYTGEDTGRIAITSVPGYPTDTYTNPNAYTQELNGGGPKIGTGILLKVMAGDSILVRANSWYNNTATPGTAVSPVADIVNALAYSVPGASGSKILQSQLTNTALSPDINSFLTARDAGGITTKPQAWLNVVLLDEHLNPVPLTGDGNNSYFQQVGANNVFTTHTANRLMTKSGYVYIYVSNETPNIDVFFDNLQVTQVRGPLIETDNYMPFGLLQAGLSSQSAGGLQNKLKFNGGNELQSGEFSDGTSLNWYDAEHRICDPQIGRFLQIDKLGELSIGFSPYAFASDNPILRNDPLGLADTITTNLAPVTVSTPAKNSITYALNHGGLEDATGWVHTMIGYGHAIAEIQNWADHNTLLSDRAWRLITIALKPASLAYDAQMKEYWKEDGELYKFFLTSVCAEGAGELLALLGEGATAAEGTEAIEGGTEANEAEAISKAAGNPQVNRTNGNGFRDQFAEAMQQAGRDIDLEVPKKTPFGIRVIDIQVRQGERVLGGIETKLGGSRYHTLQRLKDAYLGAFGEWDGTASGLFKVTSGKYPVHLVRGPF